MKLAFAVIKCSHNQDFNITAIVLHDKFLSKSCTPIYICRYLYMYLQIFTVYLSGYKFLRSYCHNFADKSLCEKYILCI